MLSYEYHCPKCQHTQTVRHSIKNDPEVICEKCETRMSRQISGSSVNLITGKKNFNQLKAEQWKNVTDMEHAKRVKNWIEHEARPKARQSLAESLDKRGELRKTGTHRDDHEGLAKQVVESKSKESSTKSEGEKSDSV